MSNRPSLSTPSILLATWFGAGLAPIAPGTVGSIAALPFIVVLGYFQGQLAVLVFAVVVFAVGVWASAEYIRKTSTEDPSPVVIDEVAGQAMTFLPVAHFLTWQIVLAGFILFRIFDVLKPWPINWLDQNVKDGLGVMMDDVAAGIAAGICLYVWVTYFPTWLGL